jgi:hypothetical protein
MASGIFALVAGLAHRPQRSRLLFLHDNQHDTPYFLKSLLNFFVAKREKSGVALTMSLGKWETIAVKRHYRPHVIRLYEIDPRWSEQANDVRSHCRPQCNNQPRKLSLEIWKLKNLRAFLETSQLLYATPNAIIDREPVTSPDRKPPYWGCLSCMSEAVRHL